MERVTEITVFLENHPGSLGRIAGSLGEHGINIQGFTLTNALDHGALRMVVDQPSAAVHLFGEHNLLTLENDVIRLQLANEAGGLSALGSALSRAEINVEYAYGSAGPNSGQPSTLFLRVSDVEAACRVLGELPGVE